MAIRDRFRRAMRRSDDSDTISQTDSNTTDSSARQSSSSESAPQLSLKKTSSVLSRLFKDTKEKEAKKEEKDRKKTKGRTWKHPSEKPLTEQNLKHQEMLSHFTMTFGASDPTQVQELDFDGISPCCTRNCSIDLGSPDSI
ncbi:uncharacterized protein TRIVIDRAFT_217229 [Trichoderma virens Gv29-8]|uniref:Uncharacterized protein n=1 Tax=Hypocrea virens (strain Gv29-8 / FGSC 10586) TaxID=413071 RepID=G9NCL8_HYPVG|nr:uncharacterized protein TRIVIDRAFT_217229 [Trichoderma virens Gv29-8]EHK15440.1 hypothetical protein TRIVIDRAFT_217229 [Trichoderma virens Gv29-8]